MRVKKPDPQPPKSGEMWELHESWNPTSIHLSSGNRVALVIKEMCINDSTEECGLETHASDPLDPIYRSLVEGHVVDLHWSWFKRRLSQP